MQAKYYEVIFVEETSVMEDKPCHTDMMVKIMITGKKTAGNRVLCCGLHSSGSGQGQWRAVVNTITSLLVP
jgi:hypothetical protein